MAGEAYPKQFRDLTKIFNGTTPASDLKMSDIFPIQHVDSSSATNTLNQVTVAQCFCQPVAVVNNTPNDGRYTADCVNFPDFSIRDTDNNHILYGLKVRVSFPNGITYGSVSGGTCPELNINGSGSLKMLAQGKTMAAGAASAGQTMEFTLIPYGNGEIAWDADSNVRESTSDYTIYTDGSTKYTKTKEDSLLSFKTSLTVIRDQSSTIPLSANAYPIIIFGDTTANNIVLDVVINWGGTLKVKRFGSSLLSYTLSNSELTISAVSGSNPHFLAFSL